MSAHFLNVTMALILGKEPAPHTAIDECAWYLILL